MGGFAERKPGTFLVSHISARGRLVAGFGRGGVSVVPFIHATPQRPPRVLSLAGGRLLVVGLDRTGRPTVVRLRSDGRADRAYGHDGVASFTPPGSSGHALVAAATLEPDGKLVLALYAREVPQPVNEPMIAPGLGEGPLELSASGAPVLGFGVMGVASLPFTPTFQGVSSSLFDGLFALPGGAVEVSFGGAGELFRLTATGVLDASFGASGHTNPHNPSSALAMAPDGEVFSVSRNGALSVTGVLGDGAPEPSLGGAPGERFPTPHLQERNSSADQQTQLLASDGSLSVLLGEELLRISR